MKTTYTIEHVKLGRKHSHRVTVQRGTEKQVLNGDVYDKHWLAKEACMSMVSGMIDRHFGKDN